MVVFPGTFESCGIVHHALRLPVQADASALAGITVLPDAPVRQRRNGSPGGRLMTGMVLVADDLGAWLTGLLADAGRKKLTTLVLGTDRERARRSAATAAVRLTAASAFPGCLPRSPPGRPRMRPQPHLIAAIA
jgi:hypothetical protein